METLECIKTRRSCRAFLDREVEREKIEKVVEAGLLAPTGHNSQCPHIAVITDPGKIEELSLLNAKIMGTDKDPFYGAKAILLVYCEDFPTAVYDGSLCLGYMLLEATELGLSSIWVHRAKEEFESEEGTALFRKWGLIKDDERFIGIGHCCLGYPAAPAREKAIKADRVAYLDK